MPAHSDVVIQRVLRDLDVEIWDWRKVDMSIPTIHKVAPKVIEVSLYWSGNDGVLTDGLQLKALLL